MKNMLSIQMLFFKIITDKTLKIADFMIKQHPEGCPLDQIKIDKICPEQHLQESS